MSIVEKKLFRHYSWWAICSYIFVVILMIVGGMYTYQIITKNSELTEFEKTITVGMILFLYVMGSVNFKLGRIANALCMDGDYNMPWWMKKYLETSLNKNYYRTVILNKNSDEDNVE